MRYGMNLYFESAAMIPTLVTIGKMLESMSKGRTTDALKGLIWLSPQTAVLYRNEEEREVSIEEVKEGDIFIVRPGGSIPVDNWQVRLFLRRPSISQAISGAASQESAKIRPFPRSSKPSRMRQQ